MNAYKNWNKALVKHYFNEENKNKEVILYADKELISKIGQKNGLGDYDDFLKTILLGFHAKIKLFDDMYYSKRDVTVTKKLKRKSLTFLTYCFQQTKRII